MSVSRTEVPLRASSVVRRFIRMEVNDNPDREDCANFPERYAHEWYAGECRVCGLPELEDER